MKKSLMVLSILLIVVVVSVSGCISINDTPQNTNDDLVNLNSSLNTSDNHVQVDNITQYSKIINKSHSNPKVNSQVTSDILSKDKIKAAYEDIFGKLSDGKKFNFIIEGPYEYSNKTPYYVLTSSKSFEDENIQIMLEVDAKKLPNIIEGQNPKIDTVFNSYIITLKSDDSINPKYTQQQIQQKAIEIHKENFNISNEDKYVINLYRTDDGRAVYEVNINDCEDYMYFDADTGELLYHTYFDKHAGDTVGGDSEAQARQVAQNALDSKHYSFAEYLSLGQAHHETEPGSNTYDFDIIYTHSDGTQEIIGDIKVNAFTLAIMEFNINEDQVTNDIQNNTNSSVENLENNTAVVNNSSVNIVDTQENNE